MLSLYKAETISAYFFPLCNSESLIVIEAVYTSAVIFEIWLRQPV